MKIYTNLNQNFESTSDTPIPNIRFHLHTAIDLLYAKYGFKICINPKRKALYLIILHNFCTYPYQDTTKSLKI